jgi:hypothetical protein
LVPIVIHETVGYGGAAVVLFLLAGSPRLVLGTGVVDLGMALLLWEAFVKIGAPTGHPISAEPAEPVASAA